MSVGEITARRPKNAIVILLDSLNRHMLGAYGGREFDTPNLDSFARRAVRFDRHYSGSLPCIPARHDILCGTIDFLWKPWGSIEIWERPLTAYLRAAGVVTKLVSDHPHLFEVGGENYHTDFTAWDYQRGHESDPWQTRPDPSWMGAPSFARGHTPYDNSRGYFRDEADFPGPRTMAAATEWLERSARSHDRFMLFIDEFDPHEPFDTPEPYASMYDSSWQGPHMIWPPYMRGALAHGVLTLEQARQIRACYGAKLTMIDSWLGKLLAAIERGGFYNDTAVIVCTDHGHYLGEKDIWGKPAVPIYEPLGHTPLLIAMPGVGARTVDTLTTNVDICATLAEIFGVEMKHRTHGRSMLPLITGAAASIRDWALAGIWGREIHLIDAEAKYARAPAATTRRSACGRIDGPRCRYITCRKSRCRRRTTARCWTGCRARGFPLSASPTVPAICCPSGRWASSAEIICTACVTIPQKNRISREALKKNARLKNFAPHWSRWKRPGNNSSAWRSRNIRRLINFGGSRMMNTR